MKIKELSPNKVFKIFSEISSIPRGSGNTAHIADYCIKFAAERGFEAYNDSAGNVIIYAPGSTGYESSESVILQGHLDMVCEKEENCGKDMEHDGIELCTDGEKVWANGTTLGADDGIAIAYALALLDSRDIPHPPLEIIFTRDEETGMFGAVGLDTSKIKSRRIINIDSEDEGILTAGSAGGARVSADMPVDYVPCGEKTSAFRIEINGLSGGHSGIDINKHRQNAIKLLGKLLKTASAEAEINVSKINGGGKSNVIPSFAEAEICTDCPDEFNAAIRAVSAKAEKQIKKSEPNISITISNITPPKQMPDSESSKKIIHILSSAPDGVIAMSDDIPDMVRTSLNFGTALLDAGDFKAEFLIRSNSESEKKTTVDQTVFFMKQFGAKTCIDSQYPSWEYRKNSPLRNIMVKAFEEIYNKKPEIAVIHAGLECGIFSDKIKDADIVSIGPDLRNIHTPGEYMVVSSVERTWRYLLKTLEMLK